MFKDLVAIERWVENRKVEGFPIPTYRNCYLTFYKDSDEAISGNTYVKDITDAFNANGITGKKSKGHMPRSEMASKLTELR